MAARRRLSHSERGQMLILFVAIFTILLGMGAFAVDQGLFLGQRRDSQKDADTAALAGAIQLLQQQDAISAQSAANTYITDNEPAGNAAAAVPIQVDGSCFSDGRLNAVDVKIQYKTTGLFLKSLGVGSPSVQAHAKACAGAAETPSNLVPVESFAEGPGPCFDTDLSPRIGGLCPIEYGASGSASGAARGILDLQASGDSCSDATGSGDITNLIANGVPGKCLINAKNPPSCDPSKNGPWYDCVAVQDGNPLKVVTGFNQRLTSVASVCGPGFVDDFAHTVDLVATAANGDPLYQPADCNSSKPGLQVSPRLITIIILQQAPSGPSNTGFPIYGFAAMYVNGCAGTDTITDPNSPAIDRFCTPPNATIVPAVGFSFVSYNPAPVGAPPCGTKNNPSTCTPTPTFTPVPTKTATPTATSTRQPTATNTPGPAPTATPTSSGGGSCGGGGGGGCGHVVVYGQFLDLILKGSGVGPATGATTVFSVALVQ